MDWLRKVCWWRTPPKEETENLENIIARWESWVIYIQAVLIWDNPTQSLIHFSFVNVFFWSIVYLGFKLYELIFLTLLVAATIDWLKYQGILNAFPKPTLPTATRYQVLSAEELCTSLRKIYNGIQSICLHAQTFRATQPAMFCLITCGCCLLLSIIGRFVSGANIIFAFILSMFTIPALCVRYPEYWQLFCSFFSHCAAGNEDDYLPETSDDAIRILNLVEEPQGFTSPVEAQLYPEISSMPSCENSLDGFLDSDVNIPSPRQVDEDLSDDSDISEPIEIKFKSKHFNGDGSSTSSGEELSKGLRFRGNIKREPSSDSSESFELVSKDDL